MLEAISKVCDLCANDRETVSDLFLHHEFSSLLCRHFLDRCGVSWSMPVSLNGVPKTWRLAPFFCCGLIMRKVAPLLFFGHLKREQQQDFQMFFVFFG